MIASVSAAPPRLVPRPAPALAAAAPAGSGPAAPVPSSPDAFETTLPARSGSAFLSPRSVAVIGGSDQPGKVGYALVKNLLDGYQGRLYVVNPKRQEVQGVRSYASPRDLPEPVDLAIVAVPAAAVPGALKACTDRGVPNSIVISAGFKETGPEGAAREKEIQEIARGAGHRVMGPNCLGLINTAVGLNASFAANTPHPGAVALVTQSGAVATALMDAAEGEHVGFSVIASMGNKSDVSEPDLLRWLEGSPSTRVILTYTEGVQDGKAFMEAVQDSHVPVVVLKAGRSEAGARAASSHTGALAGSGRVFDAAAGQAGVVPAEDMEELVDLGKAFSQQPLPQGRRVVIVTNAGGPGILATDACERHGLDLVALGAERAQGLKAALPGEASVRNPIDVLGDARTDRYEKALDAALGDPGVDAVLVLLSPQGMTEPEQTAQAVARLQKQYGKPVLASFMGGPRVLAGVETLERAGIPVYPYPHRAARALAAMAEYASHRAAAAPSAGEGEPLPEPDREVARQVIEGALAEGRGRLEPDECMRLLGAYGIPTVQAAQAADLEGAVSAAESMGYPVALKIVSPDIVHKSDVGGVKLDVGNEAALREAWQAMMGTVTERQPGARIEGVLVQQMAPRGREIIAGLTRDEQFGAVLMTGLGGIYVEALKDVAFRVCPIEADEARSMLEELRSAPLLRGVRGEKPVDLPALSSILARVSRLGAENPEIAELDVNPLIASDRGVIAVDGRVSLKKR